jgi:hypothetical protein
VISYLRHLAAALAMGAAIAATPHARGSADREGPSQTQARAAASIWIGHEAEVEAHLKDANVSNLEDIGTGVTNPQRGHLDRAHPFDSLVWKPIPPGRRAGHWESYKSEIAAYELDKLLHLQMVPPAVEREIDGETGAVIIWLSDVKSVKQSGGKVPNGAIWARAIRRMQTFDDLIGNPDRNGGNILIGRPGELILIDHSRAFVESSRLPWPIQRVDADLWRRIQSVTRQDLERVLGPWMSRGAIDAVMERRARMTADVDKLVAKNGRARVIIE